jgi:lysophospholipase L1-like esterase
MAVRESRAIRPFLKNCHRSLAILAALLSVIGLALAAGPARAATSAPAASAGDFTLTLSASDIGIDPSSLQTAVNDLNTAAAEGDISLSDDLKQEFTEYGGDTSGWPTGISLGMTSDGTGAIITISDSQAQSGVNYVKTVGGAIIGIVTTIAVQGVCTSVLPLSGIGAALVPVVCTTTGMGTGIFAQSLWEHWVDGDLNTAAAWADILIKTVIGAAGGFLWEKWLSQFFKVTVPSFFKGFARWLQTRARTFQAWFGTAGYNAAVGLAGIWGNFSDILGSRVRAYDADNPVESPGDLRVLSFGDSITWGYLSSGGGGYRCDLQNNLADMGLSYQFVGSQSAGDCAQPDNEGHSGWTIGQLAGIEHCTISQYQPNIVLLDIGTNDINNGGSPDAAVAALKNLVNNIISDDPGVTVLVSSLILTQNPTVAGNMTAFNQQVSAWLASISPAQHVLYVDQSAVHTGDLADGLHPNDNGYNLMASAWTDAISQAIGYGWVGSAHAPGSSGCNGGTVIWEPQGVIASGPGTAPPDQPGGEPLAAGARVQFADITGDGRADYLQVNADGSVDAWLNEGPNGVGGVVWKSVGEIASGVGSPGSEVQFADLNGDGKADYLVVNPADGTTTAWANGGQNASAPHGWLWSPLPVVVNGEDDIGQNPNILGDPSGTRVEYADINGDGKADFLAVLPNGSVYAWLNQGVGNGAFDWTPLGLIASGVGSPGSEVQFADLTGDGKADYLVVDPANGAVTMWLNGGANASANNGWNWIPRGQIASGAGTAIQFGDINGDGKADYLNVDPSDGAVTAYQNGGASSAAPGGWLWLPLGSIASGIGNQIQFADVNGNGRADYLDVRPDGSVLEWYNSYNSSNGKIVWVGPITIATGVGAPGAEVHFADVFGTGRADYLVVDPATGAVTAWENEGPSSSGTSRINWVPKGVIATGVGALGSEVHFADIWATGRADYLTVDPSTGAVDDWYNAGPGTNELPIVWIPHLHIATGTAPGNEIRFADLYGTGRADYLVVNPDSSVQAWLNDGPNSAATGGWLWLPQGTVATGVGAPGSQIQFADLTGSGRADYLDVNPDGSVLAWFNGV